MRQTALRAVQILQYAAARPVGVGAVVEDHVDEGDAEGGEAAHDQGEGTNLFLVFQAQLGSVARFPLISIGIALILGALLDLEHVLKRWPVPGTVIVATLSYSLYLTHKSVFHGDRLVFGEENLQGSFGFVVYLVTSFAVAVVLWFCVERAFLLLRDHILSSSR